MPMSAVFTKLASMVSKRNGRYIALTLVALDVIITMRFKLGRGYFVVSSIARRTGNSDLRVACKNSSKMGMSKALRAQATKRRL